MNTPVISAKLEAFVAIYGEALVENIKANPESYFYSLDYAGIVIAKMRVAFERDSYNHDSPAIKKTCKKLGIKHTRKAINQYLREP